MLISGYMSMIDKGKTVDFSVSLIRNYQLYGVLVSFYVQL